MQGPGKAGKQTQRKAIKYLAENMWQKANQAQGKTGQRSKKMENFAESKESAVTSTRYEERWQIKSPKAMMGVKEAQGKGHVAKESDPQRAPVKSCRRIGKKNPCHHI